MTKEEFKECVRMALVRRGTWEQFFEELWQLHVQELQNGLGSKNCADCTNYKGCVTCVDGNMAETEYPEKGGEQ